MSSNLIIVTINDCSNYGNRLQNYALNKLLKKYGYVDTAYCSRRPSYIAASSVFLRFAFEAVRNINNLLLIFKKQLSFIRFTNKYISTKKIKIDAFHGARNKIQKTKYVLGSDQIWNYQIASDDLLKLRLGSFASSEDVVISYAASFGVSEIDKRHQSIFQKYLPHIRAISVREDRGVELVREMTGLDSTVVLDPTLMLTADEWLNITEDFVPVDDKYVLTYFLGCPSNEQERDIKAFAKSHGCRVRRMMDFRDKRTYVAGPQDFVELFSKARYVFTDSYHACCFSILFHKQFTVFNRTGMTGKSSMNSRMETLFRLFDLDSVVMDEGVAPQIDYAKVDQLLAQHRAESQDWLDKAVEA